MRSRVLPRALTTILAAAGLAFAAGCDDEDGGGAGGCADPAGTDDDPVDFAAEVEVIFTSNCLCHLQAPDGTQTAPFLTLNPGVAASELVGVASASAPLARVEPGCRDDSYLWHKIQGTHEEVGGTGTQMPPGDMLSEAQIELIGRWISSGAAG